MNNLKKLRVGRNLTIRDLAEQLNISHTTVSRIENGDTHFNNDYIKLFTEFFGVSADYLLGLPINAIPYNDGTFKQVKILGSVHAGEPNIAEENLLGYLPAIVDNSDDYFYLTVSGDSMSPTFEDGDCVLVEYKKQVLNNQIVVAGLNGNEATVKRYREISGEKFLFPDNQEYEAIKLSEDLNPYIVGVVVATYKKIR